MCLAKIKRPIFKKLPDVIPQHDVGERQRAEQRLRMSPIINSVVCVRGVSRPLTSLLSLETHQFVYLSPPVGVATILITSGCGRNVISGGCGLT